jgi:hypothetical protein
MTPAALWQAPTNFTVRKARGVRMFAVVLVVSVLVAFSDADDGGDEADPQGGREVGIVEVSDEDVYSEQCGLAVGQAAAIGDMEDSVEDLAPAIVACEDLDELRNATDDHPTALDGVDLETFVTNRCMYSDDDAVTAGAIGAEADS